MTLLSEEELKERFDAMAYPSGAYPVSLREIHFHIFAQAAEIERLRKSCGDGFILATELRDKLTASEMEALHRSAEIERLRADLEQERVRLAGAGCAAKGYGGDCKPGDYGHSASFDDAKETYDQYVAGLAEIESLRARLSESEAAVRVLSEALTQIRGNVEHSNGENADDDLRLATASGIISAALSSLPSSAAANAESHRRMRELLAAYEQWEADLVMSNEAWQDSLPRFTQELYDRWMELQARRNEILNPALPSAGKLHQELQGDRDA